MWAVVGFFVCGPECAVTGAVIGYSIGDSIGAAIEGRQRSAPTSLAPEIASGPSFLSLSASPGAGVFGSLDAASDFSPVAQTTPDLGLDVTEALADDLGLSPSVAEHIAPALETAAPPSIWADVILFGVGVLGSVATGGPLVPDPTDPITLGAAAKGAAGLARAGKDIVVLGRFGRHYNRLKELARRVGGRVLDKSVKNVDRYVRQNIKNADALVVRTTNVTRKSYTFLKELRWIKRYKKDTTFVGPKNRHIDDFFGESVTGP